MDTSNVGGIIVGIVTTPFILILLIVILVFARSARKASASKRWPSASGRIVSSSVGSHQSLNSNGTHTTIYEPKIMYEYTADGQRLQSSQISYGAIDGTSSSDWAEKIAAKYPEGGMVQVFYNPANPSDAVLEHSGAGGNIALMMIFVVVEIILVGILVAGLTGRMG